MRPAETLARFDRFLAERELRLDAVILGGAALNLLGIILRPTKDCDVIRPWLEQRDGNPDWPTHVRAVLADLARRPGHGV